MSTLFEILFMEASLDCLSPCHVSELIVCCEQRYDDMRTWEIREIIVFLQSV